MADKQYDVYTAWVALRIRLFDFRDRKQYGELLVETEQLIEKYAKFDLNGIYFKKNIQDYQSVKIKRYPALDAVRYQLQLHSNSYVFNQLYKDSAYNMIARYITNPYIDDQHYQLIRADGMYVVDFKRFAKFENLMYSDVPY